ncbi:HlyD family secretion protein [Niveispirillum sp. KHB5.9]|uniref:HlyD family secretion protein n=1 Tax=Niveispirillum sp. KHB5.9 TaxID=3400269 RepID=UPI003A8A6A98
MSVQEIHRPDLASPSPPSGPPAAAGTPDQPVGFRREVAEARRFLTWGSETFFDPRPKRIFGKWVLAMAVAIILGLCAAPYSEVVTAPGEVVPVGGIGRVLSSVRGTVTELLAHEGQAVKAGDVLAIVTIDLHGSKGTSSTNSRFQELRTQIALLERRAAQQREIDLATIRRLEQERLTLPDRIEIARQAVGQQEQVTEILRAQMERLRALQHAGNATILQMEKAETDLLKAEVDLRDRRASLRTTALHLEQIEPEISEARARVAMNEAMINQEIAELKEKLVDIDTDQAVSITAPYDGIVASISVNRGASVAPDKPVLTMVAPDDPLEVDLFVPSDSIGAVEPDMPVSLRLDAFPAHLFGSISGEVRVVSQALVPPSYLPEWMDRTNPAYRIRVRLTEPFRVRGREIDLKPGMTLSGEIVMSVRPLLLRLIDPMAFMLREMTKRYGLRPDARTQT